MKLYRVILYPATTVTRVLWSMLRPFVHVHVQVRMERGHGIVANWIAVFDSST